MYYAIILFGFAVNPCCYYPCQNSGVCVRFGNDHYQCDCTRTGFYGDNCTVPEFRTRIRLLLKPNPSFAQYLLTHFQWFWDLLNNSFLRDTVMRLVLTSRSSLIPSPPTHNTKYGYLSWESYYNTSYYTLLLPPVPEDCPLLMGTKGKQTLPDPKVLAERFFKRKKFRPDPQGTNLMFAFMAQHFTHQFFKSNHEVKAGFTKAFGHGVDASNIYGDTLERQHQLRLHKDGKLKYQLVHGEVFPPTVSEAPVYMKHNRVCDILRAEHPTWDDEQLFQTTRLIIIGEIIKIIIEDYVQHLSGYFLKLKFDPTLLFNERFQYSNRIALEFGQLYHWHPLMPDSFIIDGEEVTYSQFIYNTSLLTHHGVEKLVDSFSRQAAGQIGGGHNSHEVVLKVAEMTIKESREARIQPFNEYRKKFNLKPYTSFYEFTDDPEMAKGLEELYGDIDALEFYPGLMLEKTRPNAIFGESMVEMGAPFSLKGLLGNPLCSPEYWKPSTFGGETGFHIVKSATLQNLVCHNSKWYPYVHFRVSKKEQEMNPRKQSTEL
ncbi:prostaglandin G/H synthase 1 [Eucyclogobius newberryi]|uniref:prostaglandin G/H synthase 1 n=1 Tax=Eucyclogobius newberryi TaxID=166745 RepID=UPI003B58EC2B